MGCFGYGIFGMWDFSECGMFVMLDVQDMACLECGMFAMCDVWNVWDMRCLGCQMLGMWNGCHVRCLGCRIFGMGDVGDGRCGMLRMLVCGILERILWKSFNLKRLQRTLNEEDWRRLGEEEEDWELVSVKKETYTKSLYKTW